MDSKEIIVDIRAGISGIHIQGKDFARVDEEIESVATQLQFEVKEWNQGYGWVDFKDKRALKPEQDVTLYEDIKVLADDDPTGKIYVIRNAYSALNNDYRAVARLQQELLRIKRDFKSKSAIILIAKEDIVFPDIVDLLVHYHCPPLSFDQVRVIFSSLLEDHDIVVNTAVRNSLISIFSGMERDMMLLIFETLKNKYERNFPDEAISDALALKKKALSRSSLLELVDSQISFDQIGGLEKLKSWLGNKKHIIDNLSQAQRSGIPAPKGVLLAGMPGCGKSMSAKAAASLFNVPLFRLDIGSIMGKFVGESEANMKAALKIAEQASPCVLWIDELEKAFSGINGTGGSTDITTRLFGYFLTWMQEKPGAVFVMATANDITNIPPELLRRGRFDEIFYVDLPSERERKQIFEVKAKTLKIASSGIDFDELSEKTKGFSGADIESVINDALEDLFRNNESTLSQDVIKKHIDLITPISVVLEDKIKGYQELFDKFSLKAASSSEEDIEDIDTKSCSIDSAERESAASNESISKKRLIELLKDDDMKVRMAALKNPQCPFEALEEVVAAYQKFDFSKAGYWTKTQVTKEEFNLALHHPNITGDLIVNLYDGKMIDNKKLLSLANKLSSKEREKIFDTKNVKLSRSIASASVQYIPYFPNDIVNRNDTLIEIDDEKGNTKRVIVSVNGFIVKVCVKIGETISAGQEIAQLLVPKHKA